MSEWNSMYSAPKDGRKFIIYHEKYGVAIVYRECGHWVSAQGYQEYHYGDAIGWMPLPEPPKTKTPDRLKTIRNMLKPNSYFDAYEVFKLIVEELEELRNE